MKFNSIDGADVQTDDLPDDIIPDEHPHNDLKRLDRYYTIELHSIRDFESDRHDESHVYGWMKFQWAVNEDEDEFYEYWPTGTIMDSMRFWYTSEYVKVPKDGIPEVPV